MYAQDLGYEVILADTEESKNIHFNLRYQVYCIEKGFEDAEQFPDHMEKDEYDERSVHFLIRRKGSSEWAGVFRLIVDEVDCLPIYHHSQLSLSDHGDPHKIYAEFSRLAILRPFQHLPGSMPTQSNDTDVGIFFRAICAGIQYTKNSGADKLLFLCRRSLIRIVNGMGIKTPQIGEKTIFRGIRYPYNLDLSDFPLRLFETPKALQAYYKGNSIIKYSQAADFEEAQRTAIAA